MSCELFVIICNRNGLYKVMCHAALIKASGEHFKQAVEREHNTSS